MGPRRPCTSLVAELTGEVPIFRQCLLGTLPDLLRTKSRDMGIPRSTAGMSPMGRRRTRSLRPGAIAKIGGHERQLGQVLHEVRPKRYHDDE